MGTTYNITFVGAPATGAQLKPSVDSLLVAINASMSTYIPSSLISQLNASQEIENPMAIDDHFAAVFARSIEIHELTASAFNPAIGPLIAAWGFGAQEPRALTDEEVSTLKEHTDFSVFQFDAQNQTVSKSNPNAQIDFSAIAKGYGVDAVGLFLEQKGINNYFVEIGGEVRTRGQHPASRPWRTGIDVPSPNQNTTQRQLQIAINLNDQALATSGNYRNFYVRDGQKYVHTINPFTGYPEESDLLSVSVIAADCMTADAFATAFMVLGSERAMKLASSIENLEAYFIISDASGNLVETKTAGFPPAIDLSSMER